MSNSHTQSIWKQTLAIAAIMPKLFLREKVGFGLLLAIFTLWQLLLELGILDALEDSVPINIVFTMLITIVVTSFRDGNHVPTLEPILGIRYFLLWNASAICDSVFTGWSRCNGNTVAQTC